MHYAPFASGLWTKVKLLSRVQLFATPWTVAYRLLCPWNFPGKSVGVGCHCLLQGIFMTEGSNPGPLHCRQTLYGLSHQESPSYRYPIILTGCNSIIVKHTGHQSNFLILSRFQYSTYNANIPDIFLCGLNWRMHSVYCTVTNTCCCC